MSIQYEYGFRFDPMQFVTKDRSVESAIVRRFVFGEPEPGDDECIRGEVARIKVFELQADDEGGEYEGAPHNLNVENLLRPAQLGATEDHPEIRRTLSLLDMIPREPKHPINGHPSVRVPPDRPNVVERLNTTCHWLSFLPG